MPLDPVVQQSHLYGFLAHAVKAQDRYDELLTLQQEEEALHQKQQDFAARCERQKNALHDFANSAIGELAVEVQRDAGPVLPHHLARTPAQDQVSHLQQVVARALQTLAHAATSGDLRRADVRSVAQELSYVLNATKEEQS
jgi:hypothetical protein